MNIYAITQAVAKDMQSHAWNPTLVIAVGLRHFRNLTETDALHAFISPARTGWALGSRGGDQTEYQVEIALQQKTGNPEAEASDFFETVEAIVRFWRLRRLSQWPAVVCVAMEVDPVFSEEHMEELGVLTSVITLTLRAWTP